jgi:hypothetical protein
MKELSTYYLKAKNTRIIMQAVEDKDGNAAVIIETKRLNDRKTRSISQSKVLYSIDTILLLKNLLSHLVDVNPVWNQKLHRHYTLTDVKCEVV